MRIKWHKVEHKRTTYVHIRPVGFTMVELTVKLYYGTSWIVTEYGSSNDDRENDADLCCVEGEGGDWREREREMRGFSCPSACLPHPLSASFFIYCSLLGCVNLDASGWSDSECTASPPHSLLLYPAAAFLLCLGLAWLGPTRLSDTVAAAVGDNWNYGFYVS